MEKEAFLQRISEEFPDAQRNDTTQYTSFQVKNIKGIWQNFIEVHSQKNGIKIGLNSKYILPEQLDLFDIKPERFGWTLNTDYTIKKEDDFNRILPSIRSCYEGVKQDVPKYWLIATAGGNWWADFEERQEAGINYDYFVDLSSLSDSSEISLESSDKKRMLWKFSHEIRVGDIIIAKNGVSKIQGIGEVTKPYYYDVTNKAYPHCIGVEWLKVGDWDLAKATGQSTVIQDTNPKRISQYEAILGRTPSDMAEKQENKIVSDYVEKVKSSHNLILRGAPGTGKTYLAKKIALELTEGNEDQIGFVQFHPSYDYTDFVEGLRPVSQDNGQIGFELQDGIFKKFCQKAISAHRTGGQDNFDEAWGKFFDVVSEVEEDSYYAINTLTGKPMHLVAYERFDMPGVTEKFSTSRFYNKAQCYKVYKGESGVPQGGLDNYRKAIIKHLKEHYGLVDYHPPVEKSSINTDKFVFIIDEINRGEISKIFGELFFSIDPDYRGKKSAVSTQYANLHEDDEPFYIPENVYIIGTMNDIDRSVDTFDFAMRRRFRFIEVTAESQMDMLNDLGDLAVEAKNRLRSLNEAISRTEGLNSHYHIGPSYFLKLKELDGDFVALWSDYLQPLLEDYLRGSYDEESQLEALKDAYDTPAEGESDEINR